MVHLSKEEIIKMQIKRIEKEVRDTPHHKGTNRFIGLMRAKIAKLNDDLVDSGKKSGKGGGGGYSVKKQGDATVVLIGPPSAGKSTLINRLTNAESKVAPYAFTTVTVVPGMLKYKNAYIQILDVPGLIENAKSGKGRGREVLSVARGADLLLIMSDVNRPDRINSMVTELEGSGIRINQSVPDVMIEKRVTGGLEVHTNIKQELDKETIKDIANEFGIKNGDITIREKITPERLYDAFSTNRVYVPAIYAINKIDEKPRIKRQKDTIYFSADTDPNLDELLTATWQKLEFVTVYLVEPDKEPDYNSPVIMKVGNNLFDVAQSIGTDFSQNVKSAKIWASGAKYPGQEVSLSTAVKDGMMIRFI